MAWNDKSDDYRLVKAAQQGDEAAFGILRSKHQAELLRTVQVWTLDKNLAEDIVQDTWVLFFRYIAAFDTSKPLFPYLRRIAINRINSTWKRVNRAPKQVTFEDRHGCDCHDFRQIESESFWEDQFSSLPRRQRDVLSLYIEGRNYQEIAEHLSISVSTVKSRLHAARGNVRSNCELLKAEQYFESSPQGWREWRQKQIEECWNALAPKQYEILKWVLKRDWEVKTALEEMEKVPNLRHFQDAWDALAALLRRHHLRIYARRERVEGRPVETYPNGTTIAQMVGPKRGHR